MSRCFLGFFREQISYTKECFASRSNVRKLTRTSFEWDFIVVSCAAPSAGGKCGNNKKKLFSWKKASELGKIIDRWPPLRNHFLQREKSYIATLNLLDPMSIQCWDSNTAYLWKVPYLDNRMLQHHAPFSFLSSSCSGVLSILLQIPAFLKANGQNSIFSRCEFISYCNT